MHHSRRKSRRFDKRTGGFIVLLWAAHGSIFPFRCTGRRSDSPAARHGESSTKRRSDPERISSHRAFQSCSSCISCKSSSSKICQSASAEGSLKPALSADRRNTSRPESSASATAVFPKPQGALKKSTRPCRKKRSNCFSTDGFTMMLSCKRVPPLHQSGIVP